MHPPLPGHLAGRAFSVHQAVEAGIPPSRLRGRDLVTPFRGTRMPATSADDFVLRCQALTARLPRAVISHQTAAALLGLPSGNSTTDDLHITVPSSVRQPRVAGVRSHSGDLTARDLARVRGVLVTCPARTWADVSRSASLRDLVVLGDAVVHWRAPRATVEELRERTDVRGRRGAVAARSALDLMHPRSESPQETLLRVMLAQAGLPPPDVNVDLRGADGQFLARPDLRFAEQRVILEYEGDHHRIDQAQWRRDLVRTTMLLAAGEDVIRVGAAHLLQEKRLVALVFRRLAARGWMPG
ncbi:hypothetical protein ACFVWR_14250 [Leifsonia sp. NPDC058292]|uniref:hypothetical protein n=1 Tax=Leifsonia sp. NPDC058292 TaxID=3346428 RepID=UPI0036D99B76